MTIVRKYYKLGTDENCEKLPACAPVMTISISSDSERDDDIVVIKVTPCLKPQV